MSMVCMCKSNKKSTWKKQRGEKFCTTACTTRENKLIVRKSGEWITRGKISYVEKIKLHAQHVKDENVKGINRGNVWKKKYTTYKKNNVKLYGSWENHVLKFFFYHRLYMWKIDKWIMNIN